MKQGEGICGQMSKLTDRQNRVMSLKSEGKPNKQIAYILGISEATVQEHVASSCRKLGAINQTHGVRLYTEKYISSVDQKRFAKTGEVDKVDSEKWISKMELATKLERLGLHQLLSAYLLDSQNSEEDS